jgi:retron-type reverse transcriptase
LSENSLITDCQSGFRPKHSCESTLISLVDRWLKNIDEDKLTGVLFIDLRKTFDTVNHTVLLHKLKSFGICNGTFEWFKSYLTNRTKRVSWKGNLSDEKNVTIGVPQGSILGPLFFILYINDYPQALKHSHVNM